MELNVQFPREHCEIYQIRQDEEIMKIIKYFTKEFNLNYSPQPKILGIS